MIAYDDGIVAVQDLLNGKVDAVVIDKAPARSSWPPTRPGHSGHRVCQRGLRHRRGQGQHPAAGCPEHGHRGVEADGTIQSILDKYISAE